MCFYWVMNWNLSIFVLCCSVQLRCCNICCLSYHIFWDIENLSIRLSKSNLLLRCTNILKLIHFICTLKGFLRSYHSLMRYFSMFGVQGDSKIKSLLGLIRFGHPWAGRKVYERSKSFEFDLRGSLNNQSAQPPTDLCCKRNLKLIQQNHYKMRNIQK